MSVPNERPRIKEFRMELAGRLSEISSREPALLADLQSQPLETLLTAYVYWTVRMVAPRPRKVTVEAETKWNAIAPRAATLLQLAETGGGLMPYVCFAPHMRNFAVPGAAFEQWTNKDLLLNTMGYHFFQLEPEGTSRSGHHVLAHVDRENFTVIGAFDGKGFAGDGPERPRLWKMIQARGTKPVSPLYLTQFATDRAKKVEELDPRLDDRDFVRQIYRETGKTMPPDAQWKWHMPFLDFGFIEDKGARFFMIWPGPN